MSYVTRMVMSRYHSDLLAEIEDFVAGNGMSATTFGRLAMNDPHFMRDIRGDRCLRPESVERVRKFMRTYSLEAAPASPGKSEDFAASQQSEAA